MHIPATKFGFVKTSEYKNTTSSKKENCEAQIDPQIKKFPIPRKFHPEQRHKLAPSQGNSIQNKDTNSLRKAYPMHVVSIDRYG